MNTQFNVIARKLEREGQVSNVWAVTHYILRLGSIIYRLRKQGKKIVGHYEMKKGKVTRNYVYRLVK